MVKYTVKSVNQPAPGAVEEAWVKIWLRRIDNSHDPKGELKALIFAVEASQTRK